MRSPIGKKGQLCNFLLLDEPPAHPVDMLKTWKSVEQLPLSSIVLDLVQHGSLRFQSAERIFLFHSRLVLSPFWRDWYREFEACTANFYSPRNNPHFSSCGPRNDPQGIKEWPLNIGLWIAFLLICDNHVILFIFIFLFLWIFKSKKTRYRVAASFRSRFSRPLTHLLWCDVANRMVFSSSCVLCFAKRLFRKCWWACSCKFRCIKECKD